MHCIVLYVLNVCIDISFFDIYIQFYIVINNTILDCMSNPIEDSY